MSSPEAPHGEPTGQPRRTGRRVTRAGWICIAVILFLGNTRDACAQKARFVDELVALTTALSGSYGDEGPTIIGAVGSLERTLTEWDGNIREFAAAAEDSLRAASPARALEIHLAMGGIYLDRGLLPEARREFADARRFAPDRPIILLYLALIAEALGELAEASQLLRESWALDRAPATGYMVARLAREDGSGQSEDRGLTVSNTPASVILESVARRADPAFVRIALLQDEASAGPLFPPALFQRAYGHLDRREYAQALSAITRSLREDPLISPDVPLSIRDGAAALRDGRHGDARTLFQRAVADHPGSSEAHRLLGVAAWSLNDRAAAVIHLRAAIAIRPVDERSRLTLVQVLLEDEDTQQAQGLLAETVRAIPDSGPAHYRLAQLLESTGQPTQALEHYLRAARLSTLGGKGHILAQIGRLHARVFQFDEAVAALAEAVWLRPNDPVAHLQLGEAYTTADRQDAAFGEYVAALLAGSDDVRAYTGIASIYRDHARYEDAIAVAEHGVRVDPAYPGLRYVLGDALIRAGRPQDGAVQLQEFTRLQEAAIATRRLAIEQATRTSDAALLTRRGEHKRAAAIWSIIVAAEPDVAAHHAAFAEALTRAGDLATATTEYERALSMEFTRKAATALASLYERTGRTDESLALRRRVQNAR